jgi:hypothetical protein
VDIRDVFYLLSLGKVVRPFSASDQLFLRNVTFLNVVDVFSILRFSVFVNLFVWRPPFGEVLTVFPKTCLIYRNIPCPSSPVLFYFIQDSIEILMCQKSYTLTIRFVIQLIFEFEHIALYFIFRKFVSWHTKKLCPLYRTEYNVYLLCMYTGVRVPPPSLSSSSLMSSVINAAKNMNPLISIDETNNITIFQE